jgi:hypothetical protein
VKPGLERYVIPTGLLSFSAQRAQSVPACDPRTFGATGDGKTPDTQAIQSAIDACATKGVGTVHFTAGIYLSAPLTMRSHVHLQLDKEAILLGSLKLGTILSDPSRTPTGVGLRCWHGDNLTDIAFTGEGAVDGSGKPWWEIAEASRLHLGMHRVVRHRLLRGPHLCAVGTLQISLCHVFDSDTASGRGRQARSGIRPGDGAKVFGGACHFVEQRAE